MEKRHHIHMYGAALLLVLTYNNTSAMKAIKETVWDVGPTVCHCTLLKKPDNKTFYLRIRGLSKPLFDNLSPEAKIFFKDTFTFVFDSSLMITYNLEIQNVLESTKGKGQTAQDQITKTHGAIKAFEQSVNNKLAPLIPVSSSNDERLVELFGGFILPILNKNIDIKKERLLSPETIKIDTQNWITQFKRHMFESLVQQGWSKSQREALANSRQEFDAFFDGLFFGNYNTTVDLAKDDAVSRLFRLIYFDIQKLASAFNVDTKPIEATATTIKKTLFNKWRMLQLIGASFTIGAVAKWGSSVRLPYINRGR